MGIIFCEVRPGNLRWRLLVKLLLRHQVDFLMFRPGSGKGMLIKHSELHFVYERGYINKGYWYYDGSVHFLQYVHKQLGGGEVLVEQKEHFEDVTLGSGKL